jgi:hypothetical protein
MVLRHIPIEELLDACKRIDPNTPDLTGQVKALEDDGLTLAMALVKIADDQSAPRKPVGSAPPPKPQEGNQTA